MRLLIIVPWGQSLGGAEAMLQGVLDDAGESGHELEIVFLGPGPWLQQLREAGFHVEVIPAGRLRQARRWGCDCGEARASVSRSRTRSDPQLVGQDTAVRLPGRRSRGHARASYLVAAGDSQARLAGQRAQAILRERGHRMHTIIVGGDSYGLSPEYASSLEPLVRELGLGDGVAMTGEVPDAGPYIQRVDILVNASDPEPFGIVILEGMARGVAVVAVNSGGPSEFVEDRQTGMLARSGDPEALADALEPLLVSPDLREQIGTAGPERYLQEYTDAAMRRRFFHQLETLLSDKTR